MTEDIQINDLHSLLQSVVGSGFEIKNVQIKPFTCDGSNFSSILYEISASVENISKGTSRSLKVIAKVLPDKQTQIIVNAKLGFQKEVHFYSVLVSEYINIQQNAGILKEDMLNVFLPYYGHRLNLENNDAVILMGDARDENFQISHLSFRYGLDYKHTRLILEELGRFHATGIALKINQPDIFKTKLKTAAHPSLQNASNPERNNINLKLRNQLKCIILSIPECTNYADKVNAILEEIDKKSLPNVKEPFATLLHNDLWLNNILFQYSNGEPVAVKFLDFQTTIYNSPVREIVYFIFTSTEEAVKQQFNLLIELYFKSFSDYLEKLVPVIDISEFTFDKFKEEIKLYNTTKIKHTVLLFKSVCGGDFKAKNFDLPLFKMKLKSLICTFANMGWI